MNTGQTLLAKSIRQGKQPLTLHDHLEDVRRAAQMIFRLDGRWGRNWCRFFRLEGDTAREKFSLNLQVAALLHDIGKANEDFCAALQNSQFIQTLRHEHISALLLHLPEVRTWLRQNSLIDVEVITAAVLSHHLKASERGERAWCAPRSLKKFFKLYFQDEQVTATLESVRKLAALPPVPQIRVNTWSAEDASWQQAIQDGFDTADRFVLKLKKERDGERRGLLLAVKVGLIAADAAGSGLVREGRNFEDWIDSVVHRPPVESEDIKRDVIAPRVEQLSKNRTFTLHPFQEQAARLRARALLIAPCGSGKTLAAWKWAEAQAREREVGRVIFLYPTRGTATEGFRDYVGWAPEADAKLVHGTSPYELEAMRENPERASEATRGKNYRREADERLFALGLWSGRYFSATVDQFLACMEHSYGALCLLPALADSVVIVDEVHSFDRQMFKSLEAFLTAFDVPVLCMTATLSPARQAALQRAGLELYPTKDDLESAEELESFRQDAIRPRYRHTPLPDAQAARARAVEAFRRGERVLWVVNTVDRCQLLAEDLSEELGKQVINYHGRYKLADRKDKHERTVEAFQQITRAALAVTTQVCEMSLDLDADVLVSELAPVSSLVQRFGRANRHRAREKDDPDFRAQLYTYTPESHLPYAPEEMRVAADFLRELGTGEVSQYQLAELLEKHSLNEPQSDGSSRLLDSGYFATPGVFRDADEFTRPCVLDADMDAVRRLIEACEPYDSFIVNVPEKSVDNNLPRPAWLPKYLGIADARHYTTEYGYRAKNKE